MRKLTIALVVWVLLAFIASPVSAGEIGFAIGAKGGLNFADWFGDDWSTDGEDSNFKMGICAGGFLSLTFMDIISIQPEILYTMKGWKIEELGAELSTNMNYIDIPVLVKVGIPLGVGFRPNVFAGPCLGLYLSGKVKAEYMGYSEEVDIEDFFGDVKPIQLGSIIGGGFDIDLGGVLLTAELRYNRGFTNIPDTDEEIDIKNHEFSFMVGAGMGF